MPNNFNDRSATRPKRGRNELKSSRGEAVRAQKRVEMDAIKFANHYSSSKSGRSSNQPERKANQLKSSSEKLKITFLGGQDGIGEKNMQVIEWQNDALIVDCGNNLGLNLPGINYSINDTTYLEQIRHKIRGYVISHGHLDHLGGLKHVVPKFPAPIYGSKFTNGVIEKSFEDAEAETGVEFKPELITMNMDNHERLKVGAFFVELVRITHSVPESSLMVIDTPVGRVINTGDWRLDPEPLDTKPTDVERLKQLGDEGVLVLMSDCTGTDKPGRTATEHTLQESFHDIIGRAEKRVFVAVFSSNMNRVQMIINAAERAGRKVALDGRSMMGYAEIAVRQGILKVAKGTVVQMQQIASLPDDKVLVICTGGQGEPGSALRRMAEGEHRHIKLHEGDTVVLSSTPIPGNYVTVQELANDLTKLDVHLYTHVSHDIDNVGPLHVSGHACRDEYREMLHIIRPKFFVPIYAGARHRKYYEEMAIEEGWQRRNIVRANNGDSFFFTSDNFESAGQVPFGHILVDSTGHIVNNVVVRDRVLLSEEGLVCTVLTIDRKNGTLLTSPDIISRGFIYMKDNEEIMSGIRSELKRAVSQRYKRVELDRFKSELKDHLTHFIYDKTGRSPIVIPVVNLVSGKGEVKTSSKPEQTKSADEIASEQEKRFQEMRARLLGQDQPD